MPDDFREESPYPGISRDHDPQQSAHALYRRVSAAFARWRSMLLPTKPLQPVGAK
jgi:hypothetical protein